ncbi:hypothetical protein TruAng_000447 [Truncatella angustata]|nr:hypothetical protein TruAng_000447 [Truncatella angustata]
MGRSWKDQFLPPKLIHEWVSVFSRRLDSSDLPGAHEVLMFLNIIRDIFDVGETGTDPRTRDRPRFSEIHLEPKPIPSSLIKTGSLVSPSEAANMELVRSLQTNIAVPKVLGVWQAHETGWWCIKMSYIEGVSLEKVYDTLDDEEKECIAKQLKQFLKRIRTRTSKVAIAAADTMPSHDQMLQNYQTVYRNEEEFRSHIVDGFLDRVGEDSIFGNVDTEVEKIAEELRCLNVEDTYNFVFTHGNFTPRNVLIMPRPMDHGGPKVVGILDWSQAGYYPVYWEYVKAHCCEQVEVLEKGGWRIMEPSFLEDQMPDRLLEERYNVVALCFKKAYRKVWGYGGDN